MRKILLLASIMFLATLVSTAQPMSCVKMKTQTIVPQQVCNQPNYWVYSYTYTCENVTGDTKKPIEVYGTVTNPATNNKYWKCYLVDVKKGEEHTITSDPFYSTTKPVLGWRTYTDNDCGLGMVCEQEVLPVKFTSITAKKDDAGVLVQWNAAIENEPYPFVVERSYNGITFTKIAEVEQNNLQTNYSFRDNPVSSGSQVFYRVSLNNTKSTIVAVWYTPGVRIYTIGKTAFVQMPSTAKVRIVSISGVQVALTNSQTVSLENQPDGYYQISVLSKDRETLFSKTVLLLTR